MTFQPDLLDEPPIVLLDQVASLLGLDAEQRTKLDETAARAWVRYRDACAFQERWGSAKLQKDQAAKVMMHLAEAVEALEALAPDCVDAIADVARAMEPKIKHDLDIEAFVDHCWHLSLASMHFLDRLDAGRGRPTNFALQEAVRCFVSLFEEKFACAIKIRWNKNTDQPPAPLSKGAKALVALLRAFPARPTQTSILNMVERVRRGAPRRDPRISVRDTRPWHAREDGRLFNPWPDDED